jgi:hypothetical protein
VAPGWLDHYTVGRYRLEVANNVFNGVGMSGLVVRPRRPRSAVWHRAVGSLCTVVVSGEWSAVLALHCSHLSARLAGIDCSARPHVLQVHDGPDVRHIENVCSCVESIRV